MSGSLQRALVILLLLSLGLAGCSPNQMIIGRDGAPPPYLGPVKPGVAPIPGDCPVYSFGSWQRPENFENVEIAQSYYGLWGRQRWWSRIDPGPRASAHVGALQVYYPLSVRWRLKDGREFALENIDVPQIMRDYFKKEVILLQWQREGRLRDDRGDFEPMLTYEVKNDTVILKWSITINRTPVGLRQSKDGKPPVWDLVSEEHVVAVLKADSVFGLDFSKLYEVPGLPSK